MDRPMQRWEGVLAWLALGSGCVCLTCFGFLLYAFFVGWSEWDPAAVGLTLTAILSTVGGYFSAVLAAVFGIIVLWRWRKQGIDVSRRHAALSVFGVAVGGLFLIATEAVLVYYRFIMRV